MTPRCRFWPKEKPRRAGLGLCPRRQAVWWARTAGCGVLYSRDRAGEHPQAHLARFSGLFQADAYGGYGRLYNVGRNAGLILEAACWVHARRPFFVMADLAANARRKVQGKKPVVISPLALEAVRRIDALFEIERGINGETPERRRTVRQQLSAPLVANLEVWMREQRAKLSRGNDVAKAMDYMLKRWSAFTRSSTMAAPACRTTPQNERCAALRWAGSPGCSAAPIAAATAPR